MTNLSAIVTPTEVREVQSGNPLARVKQALEALGSLNGRPGNTPPSHGLMRYLRIWGAYVPASQKIPLRDAILYVVAIVVGILL